MVKPNRSVLRSKNMLRKAYIELSTEKDASKITVVDVVNRADLSRNTFYAHYPDVNARVSPYGVLVLSKPTSAQLLSQSLLLLCGTRERLRRMEQKTASMEEKMEEIRIVNRAKWQLIDQLKMTEKEAHRYIEKQAMDRCVTRRVIAEGILATYK